VAEPCAGGSGLIDGDAGAGADRPGWDDYSARWAALHGGVDPRQSGGATRSWVRLTYALGRVLARTGLSPDMITVAGVVVSAAVPVVVLIGGPWLFVAAALVLLSAIADSVDGAVAVLTGRTSRLGAFSDAMADRVSEAAWLLALWLYGVPGILVAVCGAIAWLHEYARAKAAASGMRGVGVVTVAERPTRVILVIVALVLGGLAAFYNQRLAAGAMTVVVSLWTVLGLLAAARLYTTIRAALAAQ
jgi:phosphatidylglycerophosphate synthase